jgi:hypothetical protein
MGSKTHKAHPGAQEEFLASTVDEVFFGGEAGGGKSWALCQDFLYDVDNPNANGILFRRTFPDLEDLIFKAQDHYAGFKQHYNSSKHLFTFESGARFRFSHLQHINDIWTHAGQEYTHIYWDEICHFPKLPYVYLMSRLRSTDLTIKRRVRTTGNPDGEGVLWVKARFIDVLKPYEIGWFKTDKDRDVRATPDQEKVLFWLANQPTEAKSNFLINHPELRGFLSRMWIPTRREENIALMKADPDYEARLDQLPEAQKQAYKYGAWASTDQEWQLIKTMWLQNALNGNNEYVPGMAAVGGDYAESRDKCALCSGRGNQVLRFKDFAGMSTSDFAREMYKEHMRYGMLQCFTGVDANGPGVGVFHALQELGLQDRLDGSRYKDPNFNDNYDRLAYKIRFDNWRSQAAWQLAEDFKDGNIDLSPLQGQAGYYENLHLLQEEILAHTYFVDKGVMRIISKNDLRKPEHLGRSPDRFDTLMIWNWVRRKSPHTTAKKENPHADYGYHSRGRKKNDYGYRRCSRGAEAWT